MTNILDEIDGLPPALYDAQTVAAVLGPSGRWVHNESKKHRLGHFGSSNRRQFSRADIRRLMHLRDTAPKPGPVAKKNQTKEGE